MFGATESAQTDRCFVGNGVFGESKLGAGTRKIKHQNVPHLSKSLKYLYLR